MEIPVKLIEYRYHLIIATIVSLLVGLVSYAAPRILIILAYFWPLFASTTVFLVLIVAFGGLSQLSGEGHSEKAGQGLLDYVAGRSHHGEETHKYDE